ncbi:DUF4240 domain-containing protein [Umezawaea sp.]|uniref:DUF4240 domain-containing protein n=1 Tax=Umezawaea sp. TaxID=1955258 RepID=UPI002ED1B7BB
MDEASFWALIERSAAATRTPAERLTWLTTHLASLPPPDITDFQVLLDHVRGRADTWRHWGAANLVLGGCSDDGFFYFLAWLVGLGRAGFTAVAADPDALADLAPVQRLATTDPDAWPTDEPLDWEGLDYVAREAHRRRTGDHDGLDADLAARRHASMVSPEPDGEPWDFDALPELLSRLPRLSALFADRVAHG